jgi:hypothetical protein
MREANYKRLMPMSEEKSQADGFIGSSHDVNRQGSGSRTAAYVASLIMFWV